MKKYFANFTLLLFLSTVLFAQNRSIDLLKQMTIEEKIGQLTQYSDDNKATGPVNFKGDHQ